jgi:cytochrome c1
MEMIVGTNPDAFLKEAITNPKKTLGPQVKMPELKLTDEQVQDVIAYLRSVAKH